MFQIVRSSSGTALGCLLAAIFVVLASPARADCVDGVRQPLAGEAEFFRRATAALIAALPPAPPGVELQGAQYDFSRLPAIGLLCKEQKEGAFNVVVGRNYLMRWSEEQRKRLAAEQMALAAQKDVLERMPAEKVAQREALELQSQAAWSAYEAAEKAGDAAGAKARAAEFRNYRDQATAITTRHRESVRPQIDALDKQRQAIPVNGQAVRVGLAINVVALPSGQNFPFGAYGVASPGRSAGLKVNNVVWSVSGTEGPLRQALADAIDKARLQSLVGKPLPTESASEALARQLAAVQPPALAVPAPAPAASPVPAATPSPSAATVPASQATSTPSAPAGAPAATDSAAVQTSNATAAPPAASPAAAAPQPPAAAPAGDAASDTVRRAADTVNKLRGLFGR